MESNFVENKDYIKAGRYQSKPNQNFSDTSGVQERLLKYVLEKSEKNNPLSVLNCIDQFCSSNWMMNMAQDKTFILKPILNKVKPCKILQLGGYCGYSSIFFASSTDAHVYSVEISQYYASIARKIQNQAGLGDKITILVGTVESRAKDLTQIGKMDFIFIDHDKRLYLQDYKILCSIGCVQKGTVLAGDNIITPGAPQYLKNFKQNQIGLYKSTLYHCYLQYTTIPDAVLISQRIS